jgi:O-antigen ligase
MTDCCHSKCDAVVVGTLVLLAAADRDSSDEPMSGGALIWLSVVLVLAQPGSLLAWGLLLFSLAILLLVKLAEREETDKRPEKQTWPHVGGRCVSSSN